MGNGWLWIEKLLIVRERTEVHTGESVVKNIHGFLSLVGNTLGVISVFSK